MWQTQSGLSPSYNTSCAWGSLLSLSLPRKSRVATITLRLVGVLLLSIFCFMVPRLQGPKVLGKFTRPVLKNCWPGLKNHLISNSRCQEFARPWKHCSAGPRHVNMTACAMDIRLKGGTSAQSATDLTWRKKPCCVLACLTTSRVVRTRSCQGALNLVAEQGRYLQGRPVSSLCFSHVASRRPRDLRSCIRLHGQG